jgi:hypothetical protein
MFGAPLLLDFYGNSIGAWSTARKLRMGYSGYCLKVRRDSDNTTLDIGYVNNSLDEASLLTFVGAGSGYVHTLYDNTTIGNNAVQTTAANQPRIVNAGVVDKKNSKPCMIFDGTNDSLLCGTLNGGTKPANFSFSSVFAMTSFSTSHGVFGSYNGNNPQTAYLMMYIAAGTYKFQSYFGNSASTYGALINVANPLSANTQTLASLTYTSGNNTPVFYKNGDSAFGGIADGPATTNTGTETAFYIGVNGASASLYHLGSIQEVVTFSVDNVSNRAGIIANQNTFYTIY